VAVHEHPPVDPHPVLLVPRHQDGVDVRPIRNLASGREFCEVFFSDACTAAELVVGDVNGG
jgi:alkylation response protein AidB-like acyl-CoA dehydrogenase